MRYRGAHSSIPEFDALTREDVEKIRKAEQATQLRRGPIRSTDPAPGKKVAKRGRRV